MDGQERNMDSSETLIGVQSSMRKELVEALEKNLPCEVASDVAETAQTLMEGSLRYTIRPSPNKGWVLFERKKENNNEV